MRDASTRRDVIKAGAALSAGTFLAGCGFGVGEGKKESSGGGLTLWEISTGEERKLIERRLRDYNRGHKPAVNVEFFENDPYKQKLQVAMGAGNPPDLFYGWGGGALKAYVDAGKVADLTPELNRDPAWRDRFLPNVMQGVTFGGKVYGIPISGSQPIIFESNKQLFRRHDISPPATWEDLLDVVAKLKRAGVVPITIGGASTWNYLLYEQYLVDRIGGPEVFQAVLDGRPGAWSHPAFLQANEMIQQLVAAGAFPKGFAGISYDKGQASAWLPRGDAAMYLIGTFDFANQLSADPGFADRGLGWFPFPKVEGGKGDPRNIAGNLSNFYSVAADTSDKKGAVSLLKSGVLTVGQRAALGDVLPVKGVESQLSGVEHSEWLQFIAGLVSDAPHFQLSWDQALAPETAQTLLTNMEQIFLRRITPKQFSAAMDKTLKS
jgi:raffinose/stachyose/melibiose transport system substrate-binding protein